MAKEAADMVLLEKDLGILGYGITQGRITFGEHLANCSALRGPCCIDLPLD